MRETLILNIKLVNLQRQASKLQAKTSERKTFLGGQNKCWINYSINQVGQKSLIFGSELVGQVKSTMISFSSLCYMTISENLSDQIINKRLLSYQIRSCIENMSNYVKTQEILGAKDAEQEDGDFQSRIPNNLQRILSHVEDLMTIREWVRYDQLPNMYLNPENTDISEK